MKTITLGVFLGASLLLNAVLASRLSSREPVPAGRPPAAAAPPAALEKELARERAQRQSLQRRLEEVAREPRPPAVEPPKPAVVSDREKLRAFLRKVLQAKNAGDEGPTDPAELAELSSFMTAYYPALLSPSSDPAKFAAFLTGTYEITLEETGAALSAEQKGRLDDLARALVDELARVPRESAVERTLGELEAQKRFLAGFTGLLTPAQTETLQKNAMLRLDTMGRQRSFSGLDDAALAKSVQQDWTSLLSLDAAQQVLAEPAAQRFVQELGRRAPPDAAASPVQALDYRIETLKAQQRALESFSGSLTDAQRRQLQKKGVWEYRSMPSPK